MTAIAKFGKTVIALFAGLCLATTVALAPATVSPSEAHAATVSSIVKSKAKSGSATSKLKKLANYEKTLGYAPLRAITGKSHLSKMNNKTITSYANWMAKNKKGSCYHYAALFAKMAKKATGCTVRVGVGKSSLSNSHAWAEVKVGGSWRVYDPLMSKNKGGHIGVKRSAVKGDYNNYKGVKYTTVK